MCTHTHTHAHTHTHTEQMHCDSCNKNAVAFTVSINDSPTQKLKTMTYVIRDTVMFSKHCVI